MIGAVIRTSLTSPMDEITMAQFLVMHDLVGKAYIIETAKGFAFSIPPGNDDEVNRLIEYIHSRCAVVTSVDITRSGSE